MKVQTFNNRFLNFCDNSDVPESIFGENFRTEIREINKHEIIVKIAEMLGPSPDELSKAEEIFDRMKFIIADYILHHEYNPVQDVNTDLLLWLDSKIEPAKSKKLNKFFSKFFCGLE